MITRKNAVGLIKMLYNPNTSTSREKIDLLFDSLTKETLDTVLAEISEHLEPYMEQAERMIEARIDAHADKLPDGNKYKGAIEKIDRE